VFQSKHILKKGSLDTIVLHFLDKEVDIKIALLESNSQCRLDNNMS